MSYGLSPEHLAELVGILARQPEVDETVIYGSRATGGWRLDSDIDLAIKGPRVTTATVARLKWQLEEGSRLPYSFDVTNYENLDNPGLKDSIDSRGAVIYRRQPAAPSLPDSSRL